ncbi:MAG: nucleotide exchange factor GrpE [Ilumatobacteraceae bacterium]
MSSSFAHQDPDGLAPAGGASPAPPASETEADGTSATENDDRLLRAMADADNLRRRFQREVARERDAERSRVLLEWLPVVDDLERAVEHVSDDRQQALADGVAVVRDRALDVLTRLGFSRFEDIGERFDPARHEAVGAVETDAAPGTIVAVVRPGYGTPEVILRPAAVVVATAKRPS